MTKYAIFILTNGRPENQITLETLKRCGASAPIFLLVDNEDDTKKDYINKYGDMVVIFSKKQTKVDTFDNFEGNKTILWARNAVYDVAKKLGYERFVMLDDDYDRFAFRVLKDSKLLNIMQKNTLNYCFQSFFDFLDSSNLECVCFAQAGDFIGGYKGFASHGFKRKAMNAFFCRCDRRIEFCGRLNEDVTSYTLNASRGKAYLTIYRSMINQLATQSLKGGITETYKQLGTYVKTFYSVMAMPSAVKVSSFCHGESLRIHHNVSFNNACPCFVSDKFKKA